MNNFVQLRFMLLDRLTTQDAEADRSGGPDERRLNAYLVAAAMNQVVEDYIHRDSVLLRKAASRLERTGRPLASRIGKVVSGSAAGYQSVRQRTWESSVTRWQRKWADFLLALAGTVVGSGSDRRTGGSLRQGAMALLGETRAFPDAMLRGVLRLPQCFFGFDQKPADCARLVEGFASRWPDRKRPLTVVGARTSGSYLAPLVGALLKQAGYQSVDVLTWRRGQRWLSGDRRKLTTIARGGGLALLADDPPTTGTTLAAASGALRQLGFPKQSIIMLLQTFETPTWWPWPTTLRNYEAVVLPWEHWSIQGQLSPDAVRDTLTELLRGQTVRLSPEQDGQARVTVDRVAAAERIGVKRPPNPTGRSLIRRHVSDVYRVELCDRVSGKRFQHHVFAKGVGLAYLGTQSLDIARRVGNFLPEVYGVRDGLLFRAWLPEEDRLQSATDFARAPAATQIAKYVAARQDALSIEHITANELHPRVELSQRCIDLLSPSFGWAAPVVRHLLPGPFRRLVRTRKPSVIDGQMGPSRWFVNRAKALQGEGPPSPLLKVDADGGAFWSGANYSYDATFDLACAAVDYEEGPDDVFGGQLRMEFERLTRDVVEEERWLLHRLLHIRDLRLEQISDYRLYQVGAGEEDGPAPSRWGLIQALGPWERQMSRLLERYFGDRYLRDIATAASGPLCAIDIDGVLETTWLSFPATTPAGALTLRALGKHGYRTILASGRSLDEVRERCSAYRLAGGVAEYGAAIYDAGRKAEFLLLADHDRAALERLRQVLDGYPGVYLDQTYRHSVRAYRIRGCRRRPLDHETIEQALAVTDRKRIRVIPGASQTDFTADAVNKGTGIRALAETIGGDAVSGAQPLALAVGDTASDLCLFSLADRSYAPANADEAVRKAAQRQGDGGLRIVKQPYQAGLFAAASQFIGHRPGSCLWCSPVGLSTDAELLITILAAQDVSGWGTLPNALRMRRLSNLSGPATRRVGDK